jgi:Ca-activated chloride channel family protein
MPIPFLPDHVFGRPAMLLLLLAIPLLLLLRGRAGRSPAVVFASLPFLKGTARPVRSRFGLPTAAVATMLALTSGVIALAQPQKQNAREQFTASGVEIYLAIDVSHSMSILDFVLDRRRINRLDAAKHVISEFVDGRPSDRIGLVIFSGQPFALGPLTLDHDWLLDTIDREIHFDHPITGGTMIATAISACSSRLAKRDSNFKAKSQIVVVLTDGDQNVPGLTPQEAARLSSTLGIKVYPIAIGTPGRHFVPKINRWMDQTFDFDTLKEIASITGTKAYMANNTETLREIFDEIDELEKTEIATRKTVETNELYQWFAGAALLFLVVGLAFEHSLLNYAP